MLILLLAGLLFTRLQVLFNVGVQFYYFEDLFVGWMAKELLDGVSWWHIFNHPCFSVEGGSVITSYITSLFFFFFGDNFFSLVLSPILFSLLILLTFYLFLQRYFNRYVAIIFSFLFIFPPNNFLYYSLFALGHHFESILFSILGLFCFFEIFFKEHNYKKYLTKNTELNLLFVVFGLISGFGIYFFYDYLITLFIIILFWFFIDKLFFLKKYFYIFLLGLLIGLIPWLTYNIRHSFEGLYIHNYTLREVIFSKSLFQVFETFGFIVTNRLPYVLGLRLYLTIIFSFSVVALLNINSFKYLFSHDIKYPNKLKELVFTSYISVFICIWSILYLPKETKNIPLWMSSIIPNRLFHVYPFLFVLVALCFNKFLPLKKDKNYFLRVVISAIFAVLILKIGFLNYSNTINIAEQKIAPLKIKGYSVRFAYQVKERAIVSFLDQDIFNVYGLQNYDKTLRQLFCKSYYPIYNCNDKLLEELASNIQLDVSKAYYYILIGLNTGDFTQGYNMLDLNKLIDQKVHPKYKHYIYEGIAVSLMNRRRNEIIENIDFIKEIPVKYRHYFMLELGRLIGTYSDNRIKQEKLQYLMTKLPFISDNYIHRGLIENLIDDKFLKNPIRYKIDKKYYSYFYRAISRNIFNKLPSQDKASYFLRKFSIDKNNEKYFYYGMIEALFKNDNIYREEEIKKKITDIIKCNWMNKDVVCEGLGLSLGYLTFGYIDKFSEVIGSNLNNDEAIHFYYGYCISLKERYGLDFRKIKELVDYNVPEKFKRKSYNIIKGAHYLN